MMRSRYSDEQIAYALRQAESGTVADVCRRLGISEATFYNRVSGRVSFATSPSSVTR